MDAPVGPRCRACRRQIPWLISPLVTVAFSAVFMAPNLQTKRVKWGCKVIRGQRETLWGHEVSIIQVSVQVRDCASNPKRSLWENLHQMHAARRPQTPRRSICSAHSTQGQGGEFIFQADMQGLLMGHLWPRQMGGHASGVSPLEIVFIWTATEKSKSAAALRRDLRFYVNNSSG